VNARSAPTAIEFAAGGFRYLPSVFQYSAGVAAQPGFVIERAELARPLPIAEGFAAVEAHLSARGRPPTAFCACELRSPAPFSEQGFGEFNRAYVRTLERWGLYRDGANPVARTNVCPARHPPDVPSLHAFAYTLPATHRPARTFVIAGGGEAQEGRASYRESIVRYGDTSPDGLREKVRYVVAEMRRRLGALGFDWPDATAVQAYTVHDIAGLMLPEIVARGAADAGLTWHWCRPPVVGIEFEMDVRSTTAEIVLAPS
jgi:hypothetical protein